MPALERLKRRADFLRVADGRRKWVTPGLILQMLPRASDDDAGAAIRIGFTATRKIGNAVTRNRARRRLRAAAASVMARHAAAGFDYVLIARAETPKRPYAALIGDLEAALRGLRTWHDDGP
ncbi:MAG TPA: ribonuclease P protein component [Stellaceae bacterium]|nr:ribonuclease P protein component [Stellaceae bacterium]